MTKQNWALAWGFSLFYTPVEHLEKFARGAGLREIQKVCSKPITISKKDIKSDIYYKDHIFFLEQSGKYYVVPIDGSKFVQKE